MGCLKLSYHQEQEPSPFIGFWKDTGPEETGTQEFFVLEQKKTQPVFDVDLYPFGLPITSNNYTQTGAEENRFLYQGKEWQTDLALNLYDFHARQYDPATGRFTGVDPKSQFSSPYTGMGNNPTMVVDPDGEFGFLAAVLIGAALNVGGQAIAGNINNVGDFFGAAAIGGLAGGLSFGVANAALGGAFFAGTASQALTFGAGFTAGALGGAAGGFVGGAGNAWLGGASFGDGLKTGGIGAGFGGLTGGILGGLDGARNGRLLVERTKVLTESAVDNLSNLDVPGAPSFDQGFATSKVGELRRSMWDPDAWLDNVTVSANYLDRALAFKDAPYLLGGMTCEGIDCSGVVNRATGHEERVWTTSGGNPPGQWYKVSPSTSSSSQFLTGVKKGDLFLWEGQHTAFYAGQREINGVVKHALFHAHGATGTLTGYTGDLLWYLGPTGLGYPNVYRQLIFR